MADALDLCLASKSPRRRELLTQAGLRFSTCEPGLEYGVGASEHDSEVGDPVLLVQQRARRKAVGCAIGDASLPVLAVDTVVDLNGRELGKAADRADALRHLQSLVGKHHRVHTAHCLLMPACPGELFEELSSSVVFCGEPTPDALARYLDSGQWRGKAGAYGIQDAEQDFLRLHSGAFDTVVGLHVPAVLRLLRAVQERS